MALLRSGAAMVTAFNLVPVVEAVLPDKPKTEVECVVASDKVLYIGTGDGQLVSYQLEEAISPLGKTVYRSKVGARLQLTSDKKKPVQQLMVINHMKRLLALVDGYLYVMTTALQIVEVGQRVTKVQCYCLNESKGQQIERDKAEILIAPQKKKIIQLYVFTGGEKGGGVEKLVSVKDINVPDVVLCMARDGDHVCMALQGSQGGEGRYIVMDMSNGEQCTELLPFGAETTPFVKRLGKGEFLINAGPVGVVTIVTGASNRPPINWNSAPPKASAYLFPYVLTWSEVKATINVFSLLVQNMVQEISFQNGRCFGEAAGKVYIAQERAIYLLSPVPLKDQVESYLQKQMVEEALILAETIAAVEQGKNNPDAVAKAEEYTMGVKQKAAFIYISVGQFSRAEALLMESSCDPREVIFLFNGILNSSSSFTPRLATSIPSIEVLASDGSFTIDEAKNFLMRYLKEVRTTAVAYGRKEELDTALLKLMAEARSPSLIPYITNQDLLLSFEEAEEALKNYGCYHALGHFYLYAKRSGDALNVWTRIADGEFRDSQFPGLKFIVDQLSSCTNPEVVLKYTKWVLRKDEAMGIRIFMEQMSRETQPPEELHPSRVLEYMQEFPNATLLYLEYIIVNKSVEDEKYHSKYGELLLEDVLRLKNLPGGAVGGDKQFERARKKLEQFLKSSTHYRASFLLSRIQNTDLYSEMAILYGRMDEHEKAFSLLAHKLKDYQGAEKHCVHYSQNKSRQYKQSLYLMLLSVYLKPNEKQEMLEKPAIDLLNRHGEDFDAAQVLQILPSVWPISTVKSFLMHSLRSSIDTSRTIKIEKNLGKGENLQVRSQLMELQGGPVLISETTNCPVCRQPFSDAAFVRYPNGTVTHLRCARNKSVCPVTGTWFGE
ncbi:hypothetical protein EMCRGX_G023570 [Ephydatia muelleri]